MMVRHDPKKLDPILVKKAERLRASPCFKSDTGNGLFEKQLIFYALAGIKPASEAASCHVEQVSPTEWESFPDNRAEVAAFLDGLGLRYMFNEMDGVTTVALNETPLNALRALAKEKDEATVYRTAGQVYGYPETAIEAFVADFAGRQQTLLDNAEQDQLVHESGLPDEAVFFGSQKHIGKRNWRPSVTGTPYSPRMG